jgi:hypothetical protein
MTSVQHVLQAGSLAARGGLTVSGRVPYFKRYEYLRPMGKRAFKKYISAIPRSEMEIQLLDLYERFPQVKRYYDFIFNPREEKLVQEAKAKIRNEYFPLKRKRPRARRSVAQGYLRHFLRLGMDPHWVAELMLFNMETAQRFSAGRKVPEAFYKSMLNSFTEMVHHVVRHQLLAEYGERAAAVAQRARDQEWPLREAFTSTLEAAAPET